eukprot:CAMPEP_0196821672 /NCGR_PEP_ID=MMETSP1362-20130617/80367_1 /TAXON_ID=163516 /ORGANISM="Leptocylindrus danicus, Strain CCMP1856" /LENGTH=509 /DNA_ID=CAMNT_0042200965 /DNA_START=162 /DNA_END=1691 /DNA_ORIENTATION=+
MFATACTLLLLSQYATVVHSFTSIYVIQAPAQRRAVFHTTISSTTTSPSITFLQSVAGDDDNNSDELPPFSSKEEYLSFLESQGGLPLGFKCGDAKGTFVPVEAPSMGALPIKATVVALDEPTDNWAAVFTKNKFPGAPIKVGRKRLADGGPLQALVINNKVSNVCSGGDGVADSEMVCEAVAAALNLPNGASSVLPSSTGVIGWRLPAKELSEDVVPKAIAALQSDNALGAAMAIMTTDRFPKLRARTLSNGARVVGIAKGAGMIEPNMATMLSYIFTDLAVDKVALQSALSEVVNESYNSISVDGDESTSDTVAILSSNKVPVDDSEEEQLISEFKDALYSVCKGLACDIVRNGEGTAHVMRVKIDNFPGSDVDARRVGKQVVNSPLFKCAVSGNDPNTGRLAAAIGSFLGKFGGYEEGSEADMTLTLGGRIIFSRGKFVLEGDDVEKELSDHMFHAGFGEHDEYPVHQKFVEIGIDFGEAGGNGSAVVFGSDLTKEYVVVNADYRS